MKNPLLLFIFFIFSICTVHGQCTFDNLEISKVTCSENGKYDAVLSFTHTMIAQEKFKLFLNEDEVGTYSYFDLPLTLTNISLFPTQQRFTVVSESEPSCYISTSIDAPSCNAPCQIVVQNTEVSACQSGKVDLAFDVVMNLVHGDSIYITLPNGNKMVFPNGDRIVVNNLIAGSDVTIPVKICGNKSQDCCTTYTFNNKCLCNIYDIAYKGAWCDPTSNSFGIEIDFKHHMVSDSFYVGGDTKTYGTYAYKDLPVQVDSLVLDQNYTADILVLDKVSSLCFNGASLDTVGKCEDLCSIQNFEYEIKNCTSTLYDMDFSIESSYTGTNGFTIYINDELKGTYAYGQDKYEIKGIQKSCHSFPTVKIIDVDNPKCTFSEIIENKPCCAFKTSFSSKNTDCSKGEMVLNISDNHPDATIADIEVSQGDKVLHSLNQNVNEDFTIATAGMKQGLVKVRYGYFDKGITLTDYLYFPCSCKIGPVEISTTECKADGTFDAVLKFDVQTGSGKVDIRGNGKLYGTFETGQESYTIENLAGDCTTLYEFVVIDNEDPSCTSSASLSDPICCTDCMISELTATNKGCTSDSTYFDINFKASNPEAATFTLKIDDNAPTLHSYTNLPVRVFVPTLAKHTIEVSDNEKLDCKQVIEIDSECECTYTGASYEVVSCENQLATVSYDVKYNFNNNVVVLLNNVYKGIYTADQFPVQLEGLKFDNVTSNKIEVQSTKDQLCNYVYTIEPRDCTVSTDDPFIGTTVYSDQEAIYIKTDVNLPMKVSLLDLSGKHLVSYDVSPTEGTATIHRTDNLKTGMYICQLSSEEGVYNVKLLLR